MKLLIPFLFTFIAGFSASITANEAEESGLGKILDQGELPSEWTYIVGTKDSFLLTKNGRFSISTADGKIRVTDLWKEQAITFKELGERLNQYPVVDVASKSKLKPLVLNANDKEVENTLFLMVGDPISQEFFKKAESDLVSLGVNVFVLPGKDIDLFYSYSCGNDEWKKEILRGVLLSYTKDRCEKSILHKMGSSALAMVHLLQIKRVPFFIDNTTDEGKIVDYSVFKGLKK